MSWKDSLQEGSFKGVPFNTEDHEWRGGRRLVINEYPLRDDPFTEDLGRRARSYSVTAFFIGDDYMVARDAFLDALEEGGAGTLIHPYLGTKKVIGESFSLRETTREGRYCAVSVVFVEAGERKYPSGDPIPSQLVTLQSDSLIEVAKADFVESLQLPGLPEWIRDNYEADLGVIAETLSDIQTNGGINKQTTTALINKAAEWVADVSDLAAPTISLVKDISGTADKIISLFDGVFNLAPSYKVAAANLKKISQFTATQSRGTSSQAIIAQSNAATIENFIVAATLANEAKATVSQAFGSYEEAIEARSNYLDRLDAMGESLTSDTVYESYRGLRAEIAKAIPGEDNELPRIGTVTLKQSEPSLVMAYELYGAVDRETDIINRNRIRHPGFLPGGDGLKVLKYVEDSA